MKLAVLTTVYPEVAHYLPEFFNSLKEQTNTDFDLLIANDGLSDLSYDVPFNVKVKSFSGTPVNIRKELIAWALELNYEGLIFADADDIFDSNRIASLNEKLESGAQVVFHDLLLWGENITIPNSMFLGRFSAGQILNVNDIKSSNFLGLSNTSIRTDGVYEALQGVSDDVIAFDWTFFTRLLFMQNCQLKYVNETLTHYRQYGSNMASPLDLSDEQILLSVRVKKQHYSSIADLGDFYKEMALQFYKLNELLINSKIFNETYLERIRTIVPINPLWWEIALLPSEVGLEDIFKQNYIKLKANDYG